MESMENYRSLDAHMFFLSEWVQTIEHTASNSGLLHLLLFSHKNWDSFFQQQQQQKMFCKHHQHVPKTQKKSSLDLLKLLDLILK